ncbi:GNAT family N-acetyltransferase [Stappia sp. ES.058]|uniref:GNAT family N-acetyltransferase n=1 Tax=Stappia sp. ES.058 TaxID=1881061 RepID=UPI0008794A15|nr:GNAT family N-acetyltransferase [Stappia sp. ES.058]SDU45012.1 Acetyltransferase (GNAT) family protein [Stappia sp. ES.058]
MTAITPIEAETDIVACFDLMQQLRPHLASAAEFVSRWRRQALEGYKLVAIYDDGRPVALAGYRLQNNLMHGRHLYLDDLVTDGKRRSQGLGQQLLLHMQAVGRDAGYIPSSCWILHCRTPWVIASISDKGCLPAPCVSTPL